MTAKCVAIALFTCAAAFSQQNGTTLAGYKTIDICSISDDLWRYSGVISLWNEGAIDTTGLAIADFVEYKTGNKFVKAFDVSVPYSGVIPAGTTQLTALDFPYSFEYIPLAGTIRNNATITITNHSGHVGSPFGPNPKATYTGTVSPCVLVTSCTNGQGYWGNKPGVVWPSPYARDAAFFLSGQTWQQVMDEPVSTSQGYYQLAHQYVAAVLNQTSASMPSGVLDTLNLATAWLSANTPAACTANAACGVQKDWASVLALYNNGAYPGGPGQCQ